jgi:hypothetical protein
MDSAGEARAAFGENLPQVQNRYFPSKRFFNFPPFFVFFFKYMLIDFRRGIDARTVQFCIGDLPVNPDATLEARTSPCLVFFHQLCKSSYD